MQDGGSVRDLFVSVTMCSYRAKLVTAEISAVYVAACATATAASVKMMAQHIILIELAIANRLRELNHL